MAPPRTENSLLIAARRPELFDLTFEELPEELSTYAQNLDVNHIVAEYRRLHPEYSAPEPFFTATTDARFLNNSITQAGGVLVL